MFRIRFLFLIFGCLCLSSLSLSAADVQQFEEGEIEALRDWINTKKQVVIKELGGRLSLSGEVRAEMQATSEKVDGYKQRGAGGAVDGTASRAFDIEVNLLFDYRSDMTWAVVKIELDNNAGVISGTSNRIRLERAFFGVRAVSRDTYTMDVEIGRRFLSYTFDSRIQFGSFMDGILFKYDSAWNWLGDVYLHAGPFLIDERKDQYGYVGEIGILNLWDTGLFMKYSLIDWDTKKFSNEVERLRFQFLNSQVILGYVFVPAWLDKSVTCYAAGLYNHAAEALEITNNKRANFATYFGFSVGSVRKKGDWSLDINYQLVAAQAIPSFDVIGIGRGNAAKAGLYSTELGKNVPVTESSKAAGNTNYKGFNIEFLYLFTNNLTMLHSWEQSVNFDKSIGPEFRFKQYELEFIYAF